MIKSSTIIVTLRGGLGNQMFQYALGRRLSFYYRVPFKLDKFHLRTNFFNFLGVTTLRKYALGNFNIHAKIARYQDLPFLSKVPSTRFTVWLNELNKILNPQSRQVIREMPYSYSQNIKNILRAGNNVCLDGFWNNEGYFKEIESVIRRDFSLKVKMSIRAMKLAKRISRTNSVSIHVRRKDYVTNLNTRRFHRICGLDYYYASIRRIAKQISSPYFFIFSDDIDWVRENLQIKYPVTLVDHFGSDAEELILMSLCKHNIIANSSFSWWGAWLNRNRQKIVLAPKRWFRKKRAESGIVPQTWIKVENDFS